MAQTGPVPDRPFDPRIGRTRRVVRRAAITELAEAGYGGFAIESVAARSGVAKSTIYRHWPGKLALIADALETLNEQPEPQPGHGTPRQRVLQLVEHLATVFTDSDLSACIPALVDAAERDPDVRRFLHDYSTGRRRALTAVIADGSARGDLPPDLDADMAATALAGAIVYRRLMTGQPFPPARVADLVATVLGPEGEGGRQ
jgi:TetR/AcrR family transcriptional regulator, regulator of autoinduction and epiphytic fitness